MSFSFSPGLGPRGAISELGQAPAKEGRYYDRAVVTGMLAYLRPYKRQMVAGTLLMLVVTGLTLVAPYLIKVTIDQYIAVGDTSGLAQLAFVLSLCYLGLYASTAGQQYLLGWVSQRVLADLRQALFRHLPDLMCDFN